MRNEDLALALAAERPGRQGQVRVRQGVVLSWAQSPPLPVNTVQVGGSQGPVLENVSYVGSPSLSAGDPVLLLAWGASWIVLGRITTV